MKKRMFILFGVTAAAFILVGSLISRMGAQAGVISDPAGIGLPDLIVDRVDVISMTSTFLEYRFVIKNIGTEVADIDGPNPSDPGDNVNMQGILSADDVFNNLGDIGAGGSYLTEPLELGPGESYTYTYITSPAGQYLFDYDYLFVEIDGFDNLVEADENNNLGMTTLPDGPDLIVESIEVLWINSSGIGYEFVVKNIGDGMADLDGLDPDGFWDNINFQGYLSPNDVLHDTGDVGAGGMFIISPTVLNPGESFTHGTSAGMSGVYTDYHYIFVEIDGAGNLSETDEGNNIGMAEILFKRYLPLVIR